MGELADFEVNQDVAFQHGMVKNEVDVEMITVERDPFLPGDEGETFAEFQQEGLQVVDEGLLQIGFHETMRFGQSEEFDDDRIFEHIHGRGNFLSFGRELHQSDLVPALGEAFKKQAIDLAL